MNRRDTKFLLHIDDLEKLLVVARDRFLALDIDKVRYFRYENTYYDTPDYLFYNQHHQQRVNRYKVRIRNYVDSGTHFLEIKFKNNKKQTLKNRIKLDNEFDYTLQSYRDFLAHYGIQKDLEIFPSTNCSYDRIALTSRDRTERLTIDMNLKNLVISAPQHCDKVLHEVGIIELKQSRINRNTELFRLIRQFSSRPTNISKYCIGFSQISKEQNTVKFNRFKSTQNKIDKIKSKTRH